MYSTALYSTDIQCYRKFFSTKTYVEADLPSHPQPKARMETLRYHDRPQPHRRSR